MGRGKRLQRARGKRRRLWRYPFHGAGKLPWNTSSEKAKELALANFGLQDEVWEQAKPSRMAQDRSQGKVILKAIMRNGSLEARAQGGSPL
jgi:hypothetical protein